MTGFCLVTFLCNLDKASPIRNPFQIQHDDMVCSSAATTGSISVSLTSAWFAQGYQAREAEAMLPRPVDDRGAEGSGVETKPM